MVKRYKNNLHPHRGDTFIKHGQLYQTKPRRGGMIVKSMKCVANETP
ncbi:hypothetical protein BA6E_11055 [Bacteroidales bacterium 6E]|nr:hypothetical protein BA6E_11055 [Bacteroidales bacterium 6E]